jgi:hypothetical protein
VGDPLKDVIEGQTPSQKRREEERGKWELGTSLRVGEGDGRTKRNLGHLFQPVYSGSTQTLLRLYSCSTQATQVLLRLLRFTQVHEG